jgi:hypothetical protein
MKNDPFMRFLAWFFVPGVTAVFLWLWIASIHTHTSTSAGDLFREQKSFQVLCMHENIFGSRIKDHVELVTYESDSDLDLKAKSFRRDTRDCRFGVE